MRQAGQNGGDVLERLHAQLTKLATLGSYRSADVRIPFQNTSTITGATTLTVWDPTTGFKFKLKGFHVVVQVKTVLAAASAVQFGFWDNAVATGFIAPVCAFQATDPAGLYMDVYREYGDGIISGAANRNLILAPNISISTGVLQVMGVVWGDHVS